VTSLETPELGPDALDAVAHHGAPLAQCFEDVLRGDRVLLRVRFQKDVGEVPVFCELFELGE